MRKRALRLRHLFVSVFLSVILSACADASLGAIMQGDGPSRPPMATMSLAELGRLVARESTDESRFRGVELEQWEDGLISGHVPSLPQAPDAPRWPPHLMPATLSPLRQATASQATPAKRPRAVQPARRVGRLGSGHCLGRNRPRRADGRGWAVARGRCRGGGRGTREQCVLLDPFKGGITG